MGFPLFDAKELEARPSSPPPAARAEEPAGPSCPTEPARPTAYLRDLIVMLIVLAALGGIAVLAYHLPGWL